MAKIKASPHAPGVNHSKADDRIRRREDTLNTTRGGVTVHAQVTSRTLDTMVHKDSLRSREVYDWKTGRCETKKLDVLTNAQRHMNTLKTRTVTSGRGEKKSDDNGNACCYPSVPTLGGRY